MTRRLVASTLLVAASLLSTSSAFASTSFRAPVNAAFFHSAKTNLVSFKVRNDSASEVKLKAGDAETTIAPGKSADMKLPNGTQVIALAGTTHDAGSVLATVSDALKGNTLVVR